MSDGFDDTDDTDATGPLTREDVVSESPFTLPGFFDALGEDRLLAAECLDCDAVLVPPRPACYECGSRHVTIAEQSKTGTVYSFTEVARPPSAFESLAPLTLAVVELDSGGRLTGRVDADYEALEVGTPVTVTTREPDFDAEAVLSYEVDWPIHVFELRE